MNSLDTIAGIVAGAFLLTVAVRGNSKDFIALAIRDKDFLQWAFAVGVLLYLYSIPELKGALSMIILMAFIGLFLISGNKIVDGGKTFWNSIGGNTK